MRKLKLILSTGLLFLASCLVWSQNYLVMYEVVFKPTKNDTLTERSRHVLAVNPLEKQSLYMGMSTDDPLNMMVRKDFKANTFYKYEYLSHILYRTDYEFPAKWMLKNETRTVNGYECQKAETTYGGRTWEAWYSKDIPVPDGPYKFSGLPGLILEVYSKDQDYQFTLISLERKEGRPIFQPTAIPFAHPEKEKEFKMAVVADPTLPGRKARAQMASQNMSATVTFNGKEITAKDSDRIAIEAFEKWTAKYNNPIEQDMIWLK